MRDESESDPDENIRRLLAATNYADSLIVIFDPEGYGVEDSEYDTAV